MSKSKITQVEFFAVAQPGLEDLVEAELREWLPQIELRREHGGVTFFLPLDQGLSLNLVLKTPTRLLARVQRFRCRDFPKLFKTVSNLDWSQWLSPDCDLQVHASTRQSRLKIKNRIEETCMDGWRAYQRQVSASIDEDRIADLYVRIADDECTLSLDTSGERLHKRGERQWVGEAPLRESIAAALIQWVGRDFSLGEVPVEVVDPMMGSGTFLLEAAGRDRYVVGRDFAFDHFAVKPSVSPTLQVARPKITAFIGLESDAKTFRAAEVNLKAVRENLIFNLRSEDLFKSEPITKKVGVQRWLFANPPYGERLKVDLPLMDFYGKVFAACEHIFQPDRACLILPARGVKGKFALPTGWKVLGKRPFLNGGIPVVAFVFGSATAHLS